MAFTGADARRYHRRQRRLNRFDRAGAGFPLPNEGVVVERGTAIASPVTNAEGLAAVTLVWVAETLGGFGGGYPNIPFVLTGELSITPTEAGVYTATVPDTPAITLAVGDMANVSNRGGGVPAEGTHTYVCAIDPANNRMGFYIDGSLVDQDTGAFTLWADDTQTWEYADPALSDANLGTVGPLHVFPGYLPPNFE